MPLKDAMTALPPLIAAGFAVLLLWLLRANWHAARSRSTARAGYFAAVTPLFDRVTTRPTPTGFSRMTGHVGPDGFDLQALLDSLTFRKLPALWVMVSLPVPLPLRATLDIMARPTGQEPFSHFSQLPQSLPCPDSLPPGTGLRSDDATAVPALEQLAPHLGIFADPKVKELLISPKGLRLVILGDEADRGRYLIFRDGEVGQQPLPPARLLPLLDALRALRDDLTDKGAPA